MGYIGIMRKMLDFLCLSEIISVNFLMNIFSIGNPLVIRVSLAPILSSSIYTLVLIILKC